MDVKAQREACRLRARLNSFNRLVTRAEQAISEALQVTESPYIAFSGGKDSHVVLDLVRRQKPNVPALIGFDDWLYPETVGLLDSISNSTRIAARIWHSDFYTSWADGPMNLPTGVVWFEAVNNSRVAPYAKSQGHDGCFLGLRCEESSYRTLHLRGRGKLHACKKHGVYESNPIAEWKVEDVWAYLLSRNIPYNRAYDVMTELGIPLVHQRVGPLAVDGVLGYGQLQTLKQGWPDLFNRFVARFPEAASYA